MLDILQFSITDLKKTIIRQEFAETFQCKLKTVYLKPRISIKWGSVNSI
jgi:hypothetical protein